MNIKKITSLVGLALLVCLLVGSVAYFSTETEEDTILFKQGHELKKSSKSTQYPRGHKCADECVNELK